MSRDVLIAVIGASEAGEREEALACEVGRRIAEKGWILVNGGLDGVMLHSSRGACEAGGLTVGILPAGATDAANPYVRVPIATAMGQARNAIIAQTADLLIAVGGGYGTLSEIAFGLKLGKPVIVLGDWGSIRGVEPAADAEEAVKKAQRHVRRMARDGNS
jgi:uncharacterized protein (TIGR00725 family)